MVPPSLYLITLTVLNVSSTTWEPFQKPRIQWLFPRATLEQALKIPTAIKELNGGDPWEPDRGRWTVKKKQKMNPHCPVPGCKTKQPHLSSATTAGLHHTFSKPEQLALWVKGCIVELVQSVIDDVNKGRYFAYLTRWRQPEEMYHRVLYMLFIADKSAVPHIISGELPNSFSNMWTAVNKTVFDGKGTLDRKQLGLNGEEFTAMNTLNNSAHASFATIVTCIEFAGKPEFRAPIIDRHIEYWKTLCSNLDQIETAFKEGKKKDEVLAAFKQTQKKT